MSSEGGFRGMLRKAASLVVELPEEPNEIVVPQRYSPAERADALKELQESLKAKPVAPPAAASAAPGPTKTIEQIVREQPGPNLDSVQVRPAAAQAVTVSADGQVDFQAVYQAASVPTANFGAEQVLDMINQLPPELALDAKRQMVKVTIGTMGKALGVTPETVVADASRKLAAISAYVEHQQATAQDLITKSNQAIVELEAKIAERKQAISAAQTRAQQIEANCQAQADKLDDILEFFSQDVPPSRLAPQG